ncbi:MAG: hypothetical protein F6K16_22775 [Symploca sp. SIO2B6]|nr:hypothetical protein [Symploca sp. SIO2B6]
MSEEIIWVVTEENSQISGTQRGYREVAKQRGVKIPLQILEQRMSHFLKSVSKLFYQAEQQAGVKSGMQLDEIELSVEISGEGEIKLMGSGVNTGGKGAIKLKFKRKDNR